MYDPLRNWSATKDGSKMTIGIIDVEGLGSMGIKLAKALRHKVIAICSSTSKKEMAIQRGATVFVVSTDPESRASSKGTCNLILNTVKAEHQVSSYLDLLHYNGKIF